jgi:2-polyprenyl-3-methyl-5-hydroxy-6-metoxy-1,4-benzoquinol methylase
LLEDAIVRDAQIEALIGTERRRALEGAPCPLEALIAIAHQCFNTEYVVDESRAETAAIEALCGQLKSEADYARYATYRPLHTLPDAERVAGQLAQTQLASLARRQILEPLEEDRLRAGIESLGVPSGAVSSAVRAQYEANPYPRWLRMQTQFDAAPLANIIRELFPGIETKPGPARILLAGCGTGQNAIATARRFADSSVLAVDLSRASLAYAKRKTLALGLSNIAYRHADLLALGSLGERFHLVEASGVLHHLEDPLAGWRVLAGLVEPGGFMRIGLYSELGRRHFARARQFIAAQGYDATPTGIRAARAAIRAAAEDELLARVARNEDFYSLSGCRDMLFHVQEKCFSLPEVAAMVHGLGLQFLGFEFADSGITAARYRSRFPADGFMRSLDHWHRYEQDNPDCFAQMYEFWVRKPA